MMAEWMASNGWAFPVRPDVAIGGSMAYNGIIIVFAQVLTVEEIDAVRPIVGRLTAEEMAIFDQFKPNTAMALQRLYVWTAAGLSLSDLSLADLVS